MDTPKQVSNYDIILVGAGIVGLTLARMLANSPLKIAMVDKYLSDINPQNNNDNVDLRVSALSCASQRILQNLNIWPAIVQTERVSPFRKMHVWDAKGGGSIDFDCAEAGEKSLGYIIENRIIQTALLAALKQYSNVEIICPAELHRCETDKNHITVFLTEDRKLTSQLVIGADGAESRVRQLADIELSQHSYGHTALVANVRTSLSHQETAWQRFLPTGPLAFLPLTDPYYCSIVWSTDPKEAERLLQLPEADFKKALAEAFVYRLGSIEQISQRVIFPLHMRHAKHYVKSNIALVGDAAHTIHPLAGQGLNLGLLDAASLAEVILDAHNKKRSIGALHTLRRYERWRRGENLAMLSVVEGLKQLFSAEAAPIQNLRSMGLDFVNKATPIKNYLMQRAMGLTGDLPKII